LFCGDGDGGVGVGFFLDVGAEGLVGGIYGKYFCLEGNFGVFEQVGGGGYLGEFLKVRVVCGGVLLTVEHGE
jgi:hypothetical protein